MATGRGIGEVPLWEVPLWEEWWRRNPHMVPGGMVFQQTISLSRIGFAFETFAGGKPDHRGYFGWLPGAEPVDLTDGMVDVLADDD